MATREERRTRWDGGGRWKTRHQGRVILAPRHVTPVVDRHLGHSTKATASDEASSTAIKARLVASRRSISRTASSFWSRSPAAYIDVLSRESRSMRDRVEAKLYRIDARIIFRGIMQDGEDESGKKRIDFLFAMLLEN